MELRSGRNLLQDLNSGSLTYNASVHYQDEYQTSSFPANAQGADGAGVPIIIQKQFTQVEERTLLDAFITWANNDQTWNLTLYGKNLTDEIWRQSANPVATLWNFTRYGPPREIGFVVRFHF
jgi:iron complex outermembrane receptor protein